MNEKCAYKVDEVAEILRISTKTMYRIIKDKNIDVVWVRGQIRITSSALEKYIQGGEHAQKANERNAI